MSTIRVELVPRGYDVIVADAAPDAVAPYLSELFAPGKIVVITDSTVDRLYGARLSQSLQEAEFEVLTFSISPGERSKSLNTAEFLLQSLSDNHVSRRSPILSLGGGVVGDLAGFVSSIYMRGCPIVHIPTTLLAQVDSAIGGKTGVNLGHVKNQVGTFHQPALVFAPVRALQTLSRRELLNGVAEAIKTAVVLDVELVDWLSDSVEISPWNDARFVYLVSRCCAAKASVVEKDEKEDGLRMVLNFGHTLGHALEAVADEGELLHGEAVAIGMAAAANLSMRLGYCQPATETTVLNLLSAYGFATSAKSFVGRPWALALQKDKKATGSDVSVVLLKEFGRPLVVKFPAGDLIRWFGEWMES